MIATTAPWRVRRCAWVFALVLLLHGSLIALVARTVTPPEPPAEAVMLVDLPPMPAPEMPSEAPAPNLADAQPAPELPPAQLPPPDLPRPDVQATAEPVVTPPPPSEPAPPEQPATSEPKPPEAVAEPPPLPITPPPEAPNPTVVVPRRPPAAPRHRREAPVATAEPKETKPAATAETAPPPPVSQAAASAASVSWQTRLLAHLSRFKRFPAEAQMRHREGTAMVHLRLMADGSATSVRLEASSGTEALDQEAVALISRAQPLPVPDGSNGAIEIAVPIRFTIR